MKRYLLITWGDIEPKIEGPFNTELERTNRARAIRQESDEHGLYCLDADGKVTVDAFDGGQLEPH